MSGANVCRHVIRAFVHMPVQWVSVGHQAPKECLQIHTNVRVGVFLDQQGCGGVLDKYTAQTIRHARGCHNLADMFGDGMQAPMGRGDLKCSLMHGLGVYHP